MCVCVSVCVRACVRACVHVCECVCVYECAYLVNSVALIGSVVEHRCVSRLCLTSESTNLYTKTQQIGTLSAQYV